MQSNLQYLCVCYFFQIYILRWKCFIYLLYFSALQNESGIYFANGHHRVSYPTVYRNVAGTTFYYHHAAYDAKGSERLQAQGPTNQILYVMVMLLLLLLFLLLLLLLFLLLLLLLLHLLLLLFLFLHHRRRRRCRRRHRCRHRHHRHHHHLLIFHLLLLRHHHLFFIFFLNNFISWKVYVGITFGHIRIQIC